MGGKGGGYSPPASPLVNGVGNFQQYQAAGGEASSEAYYAANPGAPGAPPPAFEFPEFAFPDFGEQQADYAAQLKQAEEKRRVTQGQNDRDSLFGNYMSAAGSATDFINSQIKGERANARLMGIDYSITDEQKGQRISDYFATIWGEGDQTRLEALMKDFGNPEGFDGFTLTRGEGGNATGPKAGETSKSVTTGSKPTIVSAPEKDEELLGAVSILGG